MREHEKYFYMTQYPQSLFNRVVSYYSLCYLKCSWAKNILVVLVHSQHEFIGWNNIFPLMCKSMLCSWYIYRSFQHPVQYSFNPPVLFGSNTSLTLTRVILSEYKSISWALFLQQINFSKWTFRLVMVNIKIQESSSTADWGWSVGQFHDHYDAKSHDHWLMAMSVNHRELGTANT